MGILAKMLSYIFMDEIKLIIGMMDVYAHS